MLIKNNAPILEFDDSKKAFISPSDIIKPCDVPEKCIITFFIDVINQYKDNGRLKKIYEFETEAGLNPVYEFDHCGEKLALFHPMLGAPFAALFLEDIIALGCKKFIVCGGSGALQKELTFGHLIVPTSAVRDEGTSYHYMPASREVKINEEVLNTIETVLSRVHMPYVKGKTWTTDCFFRETKDKIALRKSEGCLSVEMECAAFYAVAAFRGVKLGQILYSGDDLSCDVWDSRNYIDKTEIRKRIFELSADICSAL